jgi:hypothetical protein
MQGIVDNAIAQCEKATGYTYHAPALTIGGSSTGSYTMHEARDIEYTAAEQCREIIKKAEDAIHAQYGRAFKKNKEAAKRDLWPTVSAMYDQLREARERFCPETEEI